jgi:hypothetical protein
MPGLVRNWKVELIEAYPDLFRPPADRPEGAEGSPECGEGWRDLLDRACIRIRAALRAHGGSFRFTQIKEKYETARLYWEGDLSEEAGEKSSTRPSTWLRRARPAPASSAVNAAGCSTGVAGS